MNNLIFLIFVIFLFEYLNDLFSSLLIFSDLVAHLSSSVDFLRGNMLWKLILKFIYCFWSFLGCSGSPRFASRIDGSKLLVLRFIIDDNFWTLMFHNFYYTLMNLSCWHWLGFIIFLLKNNNFDLFWCYTVKFYKISYFGSPTALELSIR